MSVDIDRRRRDELRRSLQNLHPENDEISGQGIKEWVRVLPED
jgi:hypothetical protein